MARTTGSRNLDYDEERLKLAQRVAESLVQTDGLQCSFREMATSAQVSVATLKHYFRDRSGVIRAVFEHWRAASAPHLALASTPLRGDLRGSLFAFLSRFKAAWFRYGVGQIQATALGSALSVSRTGESYVNFVLEPLLQAAENLLRRHVELGELEACDERIASLQLLSPVFLGLLHQDSLGGAQCRPLDFESFLQTHLDAFLRAYPAIRRRTKIN